MSRAAPLPGRELDSQHRGHGVEQDLPKAAYWYQTAAARGLAPAQYRLATLFERGKGVPQDVATALLPHLGPGTDIFCAHGKPDADKLNRAPRLGTGDIADLKASLERLKASGQQPASWPVNDRMTLLLSPQSLASWQSPA